MKEKKYFLILLLSSLFISCQSTKIYTKTNDTIYGNDISYYEITKDFNEEEPKVDNHSFLYKGNENVTRETSEEKVTVLSDTDYTFVAYSFFLKPVIITGVVTYNVAKCAVCSVGLFFCGFVWIFPDWGYNVISLKSAKEDMINAKEENEIEYYPEFHKPFTKNHIIVENKNQKTTLCDLKDEVVNVVSYEKYEYDNSIYIKREIVKDYYSTTYFTRFATGLITSPIMFISHTIGYILGTMFKEH